MLAALLWLCCAGTAPAQEWRYRVRPGDTVWDLASRYLRRDVPWQKLQVHNQVADPQRLPPGSLMRFPVAWLKQQPAKATVIGIQGDATARTPNGGESAVITGMQLGIGTALRTAGNGSLTLQFADGSRVLLQADSELVLDKLGAYGATGMTDTRMRLPRGRVDNAVRHLRGGASRFIITTPNTVSSVRGTEFRIGSDGQSSQAEVTRGRVAVSAGGGSVLVNPGQGTASADGGPPLPPRALLPAPDPASIKLAMDHAPARLAWKPLPGAVRYRVQVSATPAFETLLQDHVVDKPEALLPALQDGEYSFRVRAIDADAIEGRDTSVVLRAARPPPFAIAPADASSSDAERPRFRWTGMGDGVRYRLQIATAADFATPVLDQTTTSTDLRSPNALAPGHYFWRIAAIDGDGRATAFSDGLGFEVLAPGSASQLESGATGADDGALQVRWPAAAPGQRFRFQLSRQPDFRHVKIDRELEAHEITLPKLRAGTWYARVQTIDSDGYAGPFGPSQVIKLGCLPCRIVAGGGVVALLLAL